MRARETPPARFSIRACTPSALHSVALPVFIRAMGGIVGRALQVFVATLCCITFLGAQSPAPTSPAPLDGYTRDAARAERELETKLRAIPSPENLREYMRRMSAQPHAVGQPYDK